MITGIGMPLLGIMASSRAGGTVEHLAGRVSPLFGRGLSIIIILAIGPFLAIPRTAATPSPTKKMAVMAVQRTSIVVLP